MVIQRQNKDNVQNYCPQIYLDTISRISCGNHKRTTDDKFRPFVFF